MDTINLSDIRPDLSFTGDLLIDSTFLLLPKTANISAAMITTVRKWGFENILCDGSLSLGGDIGITPVDDDQINDNKDLPKEKIGEKVKEVIESSKASQIGNSDQARMEMVQQVYDEYMNYIEQVFTHYVTHKEIDQEDLEETVQDLCIFIKEHRRYILRINPSQESVNKNFLVTHSMRTTVLAIAIAMQLHIPLSKMIELGVTCILHEIGMLRLPPQLYMTSRKLHPNEKAQISKHTLFGFSILKDLQFSLPIQLGVLEHHEKENGSGYPRKLMGDKISANAKIIAVACTYEAISSPRSYNDERSTFDALIELIQNKDHQYDDNVLKALLYTVSLYPIGTYVYLSNRKIAEVIDSNPENPKCPVVQILTEKEADGSLKVVQTGKDNITVLRILNKTEKEDIFKILEERARGKPVSLEPISDEEADAELKAMKAAPKPAPVQVTAKATAPVKATANPVAVKPAPAQTAAKPAPTPSNKDESGMETVDINDFL